MNADLITILSSLAVAGLTAIVALLWKLSKESAMMQVTLQGIQDRFSDHAKFIELVLDRVLPEK